MRVIDLFSGVGGLSLGFSMSGMEIVFAVEHDEAIANTYRLNHANTDMFCTNIETLDIQELKLKYGNIDVVVGGPPCQGFSQKGKRLSLDDERNYLFKFFIKFVEVFEPEYFLLENVPNLITTSNGFFKNEIIERFDKLGYCTDVDILLASDFGIPQSRRRAFFLGKKGNKKLFLPEPNYEKTTVGQAIYDMPVIHSGEGKEVFEYPIEPSNAYQKLLRKGSTAIYNHQASKHSELSLEKLAMIPKGKGKEVLPDKYLTKSIYSGTWTRLNEDGFAPTITTRFDTPSSGMFTHPELHRCLTVREGARLQSFPDSFIFYGSKSSQLKQVGNAVPPLLALAIAEVIKKDFENVN